MSAGRTVETSPLRADRPPAARFAPFAREPFAMLFETAGPAPSHARHSVLLARPSEVLVAKRDHVVWALGSKVRKLRGADPFALLGERLAERRVEAVDPRSSVPCLAAGYLGYDMGRHVERLPARARDDLGLPEMAVALYDRAIVYDRAASACWTVQSLPKRLPVRPERLPRLADRPLMPRNFTREAYEHAVARAKEYIAAGDIYEVNLSQRFEAPWPGTSWELYQRLRRASPAPFAAYMNIGGFALLSSSPELFLAVERDRIVTKPIKGTRPRGATPAEDRRLRAELLASPKDDAELAMIVDLMRNDLGRTCRPGTIRVAEPKAVESYANVHHLVATIEGRLRPGVGAVDALRAAFPGGSVTGCPKIRAIEIIDELEPTRRGPYTGAFGLFGHDGGMELAMAIRTAVVGSGRVVFQVGGAVVADSTPEGEYEETLVKARGILAALGGKTDEPRVDRRAGRAGRAGARGRARPRRPVRVRAL